MSRAGVVILTLAALAICPSTATQQGEQLKITSGKNSSLCISIPGMNPVEGINVITRECSATDMSQAWIFDSVTQLISSAADATLCLEARRGVQFFDISMYSCDHPDVNRWKWSNGGNIQLAEWGSPGCMATDATEFDSIYLETNDCSTPEATWNFAPAVKTMKASEQKSLSEPSIQV
mmetsp:Transcript_17290/g.50546  ORF Transcript_17290/g.50546 Transcript_17290/m.50546 type:complete len:178 (+) Transcript_17290:35-568(+)